MDKSYANVEKIGKGCIYIEGIYIPPPKKHFVKPKFGRLLLHQIVNVNFQSVAGEEVVGPFRVRFSKIVGADSGKNDIIDSLLFLFDEQSGSELVDKFIHKSEEYPDLASCKVSVVLESIIDENTCIPNSDFVISRTVLKNGTDYYTLNEKKVDFKEITQLFWSHNVDLDCDRFLFLQGVAEQISRMKPKDQQGVSENLDFFESIIGTERFKKPIEEFQSKIELLSETFKELLKRLKSTEEQKVLVDYQIESVECLKKKNAVFHLQHQFCQVKKHKILKSMSEQKKKFMEVENSLNTLKIAIKNGEERAKNQLEDELKKHDRMVSVLEKKKKLFAESKLQLDKIDDKLSTMKLHSIPNEKMEEFKIWNVEELDSFDNNDLEKEVQLAKDYLYLRRTDELEITAKKRTKLRNMIVAIEKVRFSEFLEGFNKINQKLNEVYKKISFGREAKLELVDTENPFNKGVVFNVRSPGKRWININDLIDHEKRLASLAFVFALHHYKPVPFYCVNEVFTVIDKEHASVVQKYIENDIENAQFIFVLDPKFIASESENELQEEEDLEAVDVQKHKKRRTTITCSSLLAALASPTKKRRTV